MSKKEKQKTVESQEKASTAEYYQLNTKAVSDLVHANEENSPEVSEEELKKYRSKSKLKLPAWLKVLFVKFWFNGAVCFFFFWGLGTYVTNQLDMLVIIGVAMGVITDVLTNNVIRWMATTPNANDAWMMLPKKGYASFFLNILYAFVVLACVVMLYNVINYLYIDITGDADKIFLGVEPILYGLFYLGFDLIFLFFKKLLKKIVADAKNSVNNGR